MRIWLSLVFAIVLIGGGIGGQSMLPLATVESERDQIRQVIENSIGWAATKDTAVLYRCFAQDSNLFYFSPRDDGTISGFEALRQLTESFFLDERFKAVSFEIRELEIDLSASGEVAWYHARLDDFNTWNGQPANWEDVRWTGVLEKRNGAWVIVQMHFSEPVK